jgi:hypothetical protein
MKNMSHLLHGTHQVKSELLLWVNVTFICRRNLGRHVMLAHQPPRLTLHSLDSGREEHSMPIFLSSPNARILDLWWIGISDNQIGDQSFPDILGRHGHHVCHSPQSRRFIWQLTASAGIGSLVALKATPSGSYS